MDILIVKSKENLTLAFSKDLNFSFIQSVVWDQGTKLSTLQVQGHYYSQTIIDCTLTEFCNKMGFRILI
jgi:hypothetical protein